MKIFRVADFKKPAVMPVTEAVDTDKAIAWLKEEFPKGTTFENTPAGIRIILDEEFETPVLQVHFITAPPMQICEIRCIAITLRISNAHFNPFNQLVTRAKLYFTSCTFDVVDTSFKRTGSIVFDRHRAGKIVMTAHPKFSVTLARDTSVGELTVADALEVHINGCKLIRTAEITDVKKLFMTGTPVMEFTRLHLHESIFIEAADVTITPKLLDGMNPSVKTVLPLGSLMPGCIVYMLSNFADVGLHNLGDDAHNAAVEGFGLHVRKEITDAFNTAVRTSPTSEAKKRLVAFSRHLIEEGVTAEEVKKLLVK